METRELRYFVAVAEELHFGRAAQRLEIAQPALSRTIQKIERRLDTPLFVRSGRTVSLTQAGAVLLKEGRNTLDAMNAAERRTRRAGQAADGPSRLVLVAKAGLSSELVTLLLDAYSAEPGAVDVVLVRCGTGEQQRMLHDGRADVALLHEPLDSFAGLDHEELGTEGQVVVLPAGHPLATRESLRTADLADLPGLSLPRWPFADGTYPDGPGPAVQDHTQLIQFIGLGRTYAVLLESSRTQLPGAVVAVPLVDAPAFTTHLAWPSHSHSLDVATLARVAERLRAG
ncbi:LysR family transcriptional regulator [Kribbella lupini]|uniref:LysR family transcriptional regulator n=1 Tax=Kribbella lupini TaxID=291602 RepID=UPI0031D98840